MEVEHGMMPEVRTIPTSVMPSSVMPSMASEPRASFPFQLPAQGIELEAVERAFVVQALERTSGNQTAAARLLGISRYALRNRIEKFGLRGPKL